MTNVVPLIPTSFADDFRAADVRARTAESDWIEANVALAVLYAQARDMIPNDRDFGQWLAAVGVHTTANARSAYIAMGRYPERMRAVLSASRSRYVYGIYLDNRGKFPRPAAPTAAAPNRFLEIERPAENPINPSTSSVMSLPQNPTAPVPARGEVRRERERRRAASASGPLGLQPWLIESLGPAHGQMLWDRLRDGDPPRTLYTLRKIFNTRGGGKAAVVRYAEVMAAHPEWTPSKSASMVSILMLHTGLRDNFVATARDASPRNLMMMIDLAVDYAGRLQRQQEERERPRSVPAYENNFDELRQYYRRNQETMEQPLHDEDIFICDVRVRERGVNSANYVMEWNCTYWILLLMAHGQNMTSFSRDQIRDMGALLGRISGLIFQAMDPHTGQFLQGVATALKNYDGPPRHFEQLFKRAERRMRMAV